MQILLAGFLKNLAEAASKANADFKYVPDITSLIEYVESVGDLELCIISATIPNGFAYDVVPRIKALHPDAQVWIASAQVTRDQVITGDWTRLCNRFVPIDVTWEEIQSELLSMRRLRENLEVGQSDTNP